MTAVCSPKQLRKQGGPKVARKRRILKEMKVFTVCKVVNDNVRFSRKHTQYSDY